MALQLYNGETVLQSTAYERYDHSFKVLLLGDSNVGKTSLLHRLTDDSFTDTTFISTVGIDYKIATLLKNNTKIKLQIWDTAGQERFHAITKAYIRGAAGIMLVYDVTNAESFENLSKWMTYVVQYASDDVERLVVGNKCDADECQREVRTYKGVQTAHACGAEFVEVSAKEGVGVEEAFMNLGERIFERYGGGCGERELELSVCSVITLNDLDEGSDDGGGGGGGELGRGEKFELMCWVVL